MLNIKKSKNIREDNDLSQVTMAKILNISRSTYSLWELGINIIPLSYLCKFASYFNYSIDYIIGISNNKINNYKMQKLNLKQLGKNIRKYRKQNNISQENLARLLNVTQPCITRYEKGIIEISTYNLYKISRYLNISIDRLINEQETINV